MTFPAKLFTKQDLISTFKGSADALNEQIKRALKNKKILQLKKGLYITVLSYFNKPDKTKLTEFIASQIYQPSYLSLEYVLLKHHLLFKNHAVTSITTKTNRTFTNFAGTFMYSNIKKSLSFGFEEVNFHGHAYRIATKAKALFDYLYLKSDLHRRNAKLLKQQLFEELDIQWKNFSEEDFKKFDEYVWKSNSPKMIKIWEILNSHFGKKDFDRWAKNLLK